MNGKFRNDERILLEEQKSEEQFVRFQKQLLKKKSLVVYEIDKGKNIYKKLLLKIYRITRDKIFKNV